MSTKNSSDLKKEIVELSLMVEKLEKRSVESEKKNQELQELLNKWNTVGERLGKSIFK